MKDGKPVDYKIFFVLGISLIAMGISLMSAVRPTSIIFLGGGVSFVAIGLANRNKWAKSK